MHVLFLPSWYKTPELPLSGLFFENQAIALAQAGVRVGVAYVERRSIRSIAPSRLKESHFQITQSTARNVTSMRMKGWNTLGQTLTGARVWAALSERLAREYVARCGVPDVVHAQGALWAGRVAIRTARSVFRPCVVTEHSSQIMLGLLRPTERREAARVYTDADAVLAVSDRLMAAVRSIAPLRTSRVVPNAVDFDLFDLPPTSRQTNPFTFISVSNLVTDKRVDVLIRAFARALGAGPAIRLVVVGTGPDAPALHQLARDCGLEPYIEFMGGLPQDAVRECLWRANALVLPSAFETFGVVLVEALATGIPVIATRCGGPEEIVEPGLGLLVERDDEEGLSDAMVAVSRDSYSEATLRERARSRFSFDRVAQELLHTYAHVQNRGRKRGIDDDGCVC